ncbi:Calcineurin-like phosphoesterase superfamily domain protein [compost metagenome]
MAYKQPEVLATALQGLPERIIFCGHSHVYHSILLPDGRMAVNPGSVGLPAYDEEHPYPHVMESGTPLASYCLCLREQGTDRWRVQHQLVEYDWEQAAAMAERMERSDYSVAIRTGKMNRR